MSRPQAWSWSASVCPNYFATRHSEQQSILSPSPHPPAWVEHTSRKASPRNLASARRCATPLCQESYRGRSLRMRASHEGVMPGPHPGETRATLAERYREAIRLLDEAASAKSTVSPEPDYRYLTEKAAVLLRLARLDVGIGTDAPAAGELAKALEAHAIDASHAALWAARSDKVAQWLTSPHRAPLVQRSSECLPTWH